MSIIEIVAQIINCIGSIINMIGINIKEKRKILLFFMLGNVCVALSLGLLRAKVGMLVEIIFVIETVINYFWEKNNNKYPVWLILFYVIIPCTILTFTFKTLWDIFPIIASILFPLAIISANFKLRLLNLCSVAVWIPYDFYFGQYAGTISCIIFTIINFLAIVKFDFYKKRSYIA